MLRFMPPGAARPSQKLAADSELCRPLGSPGIAPLIDQLASVPITPVRAFTGFGYECIRLADWRSPSSIADDGTADKSDHYRQSLGRRELQSEDCLNLNIFVPYESSWPPPSSSYLGDQDTRDRKQQQRVKRQSTMPNHAEDTNWGNKSNRLATNVQVGREHFERSGRPTSNGTIASRATRGLDSSDHSALDTNKSQQDHRDNNQTSTQTCYLEPLVVATTGASTDKQRHHLHHHHHQNHHQAKLPVLVLFHSMPNYFQDTRQRSGASQAGSGPTNTVANKPAVVDGAPQLLNEHASAIPASENKANSLAYAEVARRTQSIVITFNHRIGLLGYLPYIDDRDEYLATSASSSAASPSAPPASALASSFASSSSASQARYNHAIWDQLGLLHWLKHNIANFNGDPNNITLASADNKSAKLLQLLSMCPMANGLFKRLVLVHDQRPKINLSNSEASEPSRISDSDSNGDQDDEDYLERLLRLALRSHELKFKLINEMGRLVGQVLSESNNNRFNGSNNIDETGPDRSNTFEFLWVANLSQLAEIELELNKLSVLVDEGEQQKSGPSDGRPVDKSSRLRLADLIGEPNLNDILLFPYFAQLVKLNYLTNSNQKSPSHKQVKQFKSSSNSHDSSIRAAQKASGKLTIKDKKINVVDDLNSYNNYDNLLALSMSLVPSKLMASIFTNETAPQSLPLMFELRPTIGSDQQIETGHSLNNVELDFCLYIGQLYEFVYGSYDKTSVMLERDLDRIDPFKLIPRAEALHDQKLAGSKMDNSFSSKDSDNSDANPFVWMSPWSWFGSRSSSSKSDSKGEHVSQASRSNRNLQSSPWSSATTLAGNWTQSRRINAIEFDHLRHLYLLNKLLIASKSQTKAAINRRHSDTASPGSSYDAFVAREVIEDIDPSSLQNRHKRSAVLTQKQDQSQSRSKRDTVLSQLSALSDQLMDQISSYDLMIGFIGHPYSKHYLDRPKTGSRSTSWFSEAALEALLNSTKGSNQLRNTISVLDKRLLLLLRMADLHFVSVSRRRQLSAHGSDADFSEHDNTCDFISDKIQAIKQRYHNTDGSSIDRYETPSLPDKTPPKAERNRNTAADDDDLRSVFVFVADESAGSGTTNWLLEFAKTKKRENQSPVDHVANFVWHGKPTELTSSSDDEISNLTGREQRQLNIWRPYDTLNRNIMPLEQLPSTGQGESTSYCKELSLDTCKSSGLNDLISVHFSLIPYLRRLFSEPSSSTIESKKPLPNPSSELTTCVVDELEQQMAMARQRLKSPDSSSSSKGSCLVREINKLRNELRLGAAKELDPLIAHYNYLASSSSSSESSSSSALMADSSQASFGSSRRSSNIGAMTDETSRQSGRRISNMTTRNLVNQSESMGNDSQIESLANPQVPEDENSSTVHIYPLNSAANFHSKSSPSSLKNSDNGGTGSNRQQGSQQDETSASNPLIGRNSTIIAASSSIRGFFAKTYKDAVGQALAIVVGTGALIFLLNLIIVLVIALRSARTSSRTGAQDDGIVSNCPSIQGANQVGDFKMATGATLEIPGGPTSCLQTFSGHDSSNGASSGGQILQETKRLTSSFKGNKQQQQQNDWIEERQPTANYLGGGQSMQRPTKSIKFNLPDLTTGGAGDKVNCITNDTNGSANLQLGSPVSLSDMDIMTLIDTTGAGVGVAQESRCAIHGGQSSEDELQQQQQLQQRYQLISSPPSYMLNELSDEIDLDDNQFSGDDFQAADLLHKFSLEGHNQQDQNNNFLLLDSNSSYNLGYGNRNSKADNSLAGGLVASTGPIYVSAQHQQQVTEKMKSSDGSYQGQNSISTSSSSNNHSHQHQYNQPHQHHLNRSLGSSSLTSPYGSQSTSTSNTSTNVSTAIYTIRPAVMKQGEMRNNELETNLGGTSTFLLNATNQTTGPYLREGTASRQSLHQFQQQQRKQINSNSSSTSATPILEQNEPAQRRHLLGIQLNYSNSEHDFENYQSTSGSMTQQPVLFNNYRLICGSNRRRNRTELAVDCDQQLLPVGSFTDPNNVPLLLMPRQSQNGDPYHMKH